MEIGNDLLHLEENGLGPMPEGWRIGLLADVCDVRNEKADPLTLDNVRYVGLEHINSVSPILSRWGSSSDVRSAKSRFFEGDILYGKLRPYLRKAALAGFTGICSTDVLVLKTNRLALSDWLIHLLHTDDFVRHAISTTAGTNLPRTSWTAIKETRIPIPPLPEQRRIAHVLSAIQRAIQAQDAVIAAARELKRSLMHRLFTYGPYAEPLPTKETEIGEVPEGWKTARLGELVVVRGGKRLPKGEAYEEGSNTFPYIRVVDFHNHTVDRTNLRFISPTLRTKLARYIINSRDLYISIAGTIGLVGTVPPDLDGANLTENAARLEINGANRLDRDFLMWALASERGQNQIQVRTAKTSQPKLALTRIRDIPIPLPELGEQRNIAQCLNTMALQLTVAEQRKVALEALFKSMLHQLMTGQVRVLHIEGLQPDD